STPQAISECHSYSFFFFSSRRRHTILVSDWSSDVCSSDLVDRRVRKRGDLGSGSDERRVNASTDKIWRSKGRGKEDPYTINLRRSEERRVGKEWRYRRWQEN